MTEYYNNKIKKYIEKIFIELKQKIPVLIIFNKYYSH